MGAGVSIYHVLLERLPQLETDICAVENPCTLIWINRFGVPHHPHDGAQRVRRDHHAAVAALVVRRRSGTFVTSERSEEPAHTAS
ncbi:MAG: hypothetical protein R2749_26190 [Acidimicrobiales bacterium]